MKWLKMHCYIYDVIEDTWCIRVLKYLFLKWNKSNKSSQKLKSNNQRRSAYIVINVKSITYYIKDCCGMCCSFFGLFFTQRHRFEWSLFQLENAPSQSIKFPGRQIQFLQCFSSWDFFNKKKISVNMIFWQQFLWTY